mmetsp:Transcript_21678/g.24022  ORF Transcript_21678/g.24022 Transcript_21678/m.24022 type:complete len:292 (+) Transcript_21678:250-1125(+)
MTASNDTDNNTDDDETTEPPEPEQPKKRIRRSHKDVIGTIWESGFEALKIYKTQFGHCNVPGTYRIEIEVDGVNINKDKRRLFNFVSGNRTNHRKMREGLPHSLTPEKIRLLNSIGFQWNVGPPEKLSWEQRFEQLIEFHREFGHCDVSQKHKTGKNSNSCIGEWVLTQRRKYREGRLTEDKIQRLEAVGFRWSLRARGGTLEERMAKFNSDGTLAEEETTNTGTIMNDDHNVIHSSITNNAITTTNSISPHTTNNNDGYACIEPQQHQEQYYHHHHQSIPASVLATLSQL